MGTDAVKLPPLPKGFKLDEQPAESELPPLPEGFKLDTLEPQPEKPAARKSPQQMAQEANRDELMRKAGVGETVLQAGTGLVGTAVGGLAGLVGAALPGEPGQGARVSERVSNALTYEPRTEYGKRNADIVSAIPRWISQRLSEPAGGIVTDVTGSPAAGTAAKVTLDMLPAIVSRGARGPVAKGMQGMRDRMSMNAPADETLVRGQAHGFKAMPDTTLGRAATKSVGVGAVKKTLQGENQAVVDKIAREESGLGPKDPITRENLEAVRDAMEAPYREVANLSPTAENALLDLKNARRRYQLEMDHYRTSRLPEAWDRAQEWKQKEGYYERVIDAVAAQKGDAGLLGRLKDARVRLAKNYQVEEALNEGAGIVNPKYFAARNKKTKGKELTGGLKDIANWAEAHPDTISGRPVEMPGVSHMEAAEVGMSVLAGHPGWAAAIPLVRGAARGLATSRLAQPKPTGPSLGLRLGDIGTRPAVTGAAALAPGLGLRVPRETDQ